MSVQELQEKYFPRRPRATGMSNEIRAAIFRSTLFGSPESSTEDRPCSRFKMRESRDLYISGSLQQPPKWPIECQVIPEKIRQIEYTPTKPEPFYVSNNNEPQPKPVGEEMGTVIYNYEPKTSVNYFCRSCPGGGEELQMFESDPNTLKFESRFESGNLAKVIKITNVYYELYLRPDMYTDRHAQWYYFRIQNMKENIVYRFSIVNLNKPDSLYRYGLKPLMYSEKDAQLNQIGWTRCGQNISYYRNDISTDENGSSFTLTFNLKFRYSNDSIYIAQCYPYTYTTLQNYLLDIERNPIKSVLCQQRLLCASLAGNNVYVLTITSPEQEGEAEAEDEDYAVKKPVVILTSRVHPGETPSSYMMKGIIDFLTSDCSQAKELRDRFIFKVIPMLNPDGVIVGNSRCCLLGQDLNRQYHTVLREAFPQIYHTKALIRRIAEENGIFLYCDLHGHSRRNNVFIYGCENRRIPERRLTEQVFPLMMHKNAADKFSFQSCNFKIQKSKEGTGRIFVWTLGVANSYTLEVSLGGSTLASRQQTHFNVGDYEGLGRHFCETLLDYSDSSPVKEKLRDRILQKLLQGGSTAEDPVNIPITDYSSLSHSNSEDSEDEQKRDEDLLETPMEVKRKETIVSNRPSRRPVDTPSPRLPSSYTKTPIRIQFRYKRFDRETQSREGHSKIISESVYSEIQSEMPGTPFPGSNFVIPSNDQVSPDQIFVDKESDLGTLSQTEDECDKSDAAITNTKYINITQENYKDTLSKHLGELSIETKPSSSETTILEKGVSKEKNFTASSKTVFAQNLRKTLSKSQDCLTLLKSTSSATSPRRERTGSVTLSASSTITFTASATTKIPKKDPLKRRRSQPSIIQPVPQLPNASLVQLQRRRVSWAPSSLAASGIGSFKISSASGIISPREAPLPVPSTRKKKILKKSRSTGTIAAGIKKLDNSLDRKGSDPIDQGLGASYGLHRYGATLYRNSNAPHKKLP